MQHFAMIPRYATVMAVWIMREFAKSGKNLLRKASVAKEQLSLFEYRLHMQ